MNIVFLLTDRQNKLLSAIIREFMDTAEAVGSIHLPEKYDLGVSPATVRNEMAYLARKGYIKKSHASAGRIPTSMGLKYFIKELIDHMQQLESEKEAQIREELFQNRFKIDKLLTKAVRTISSITGNAGVAVFDETVYYAGISNIAELPEYQHVQQLQKLLQILEDHNRLVQIFERQSGDTVEILVGEEDTGSDSFEKSALVFGKINAYRGQTGYIAAIGPSRMNYSSVIPLMKWMVETINKSLSAW